MASSKTSLSGKQFAHLAAKNLSQITAAVTDNLELQQLVLSTISEYQEAQATAAQKGVTTGEHLRQQKKRRKSAGAGSTAAETTGAARQTIDPETKLPAGCRNWRNWSRDNLLDLIKYIDVDGDLDRNSVVSLATKTQALQLLEHGLDVICVGETGLDRVVDIKKKALYDSLLQQYQNLGKRWARFRGVAFDGFVDYTRFGAFDVRQVGGNVELTMNLPEPQTMMLGEAFLADDPGPWVASKISMNFSFRRASIRTDHDEYQLAAFFPRRGRRLQRRASEEAGTIVPAFDAVRKAARVADFLEGDSPSAPRTLGARTGAVTTPRHGTTASDLEEELAALSAVDPRGAGGASESDSRTAVARAPMAGSAAGASAAEDGEDEEVPSPSVAT